MTEFVYHTPEETPEKRILAKLRERLNTRFLSGAVIITLLIALPVSLFAVRNSKNVIRSKAATSDSPYLERVELAFTGGVSDYSGNAWGGHSNRIVRTSNDDIYTVVLADNPAKPGSAYFRAWKLVKRDHLTGQWTAQIPPGAAGVDVFNPPNILRGTNDEIYVISTPKMLPKFWSSATNTEIDVPGSWYVNPHSNPDVNAEATHIATGVNSNGDVYFTKYRALGCASAEIPGAYDLGILTKATNQWSFRTNMMFAGDQPNTDCSRQATDYPVNHSRYEYHFIYPTATGMKFVATLDARSFLMGCPTIPGRLDYYFNGIGMVDLSNPSAQPGLPWLMPVVNSNPVRYQLDCSNMNVRFNAADVYHDTQGRTHIIYDFLGPETNGTYTDRHAVIQNGTVIKDVPLSIPYMNFGRMIQDTAGKFFIYTIAPGSDGKTCTMYLQKSSITDTDGTQLDPMQTMVLRDGGGNTFECYGPNVYNHYIAAPRGGTQLADYVDGVVGSNDGYRWVYYRLQLHGGTAQPTTQPTVTTSPATSSSPGVRTGKVNIYPATATHTVGETFPILVTVTADENFSAAQASISVSPNLSILSVNQPDPQYGPCNFTTYTQSPTASNPSFAASYGPGYSANSCTVYSMNVQAVASGPATITVNNNVVRSRATDTDIGGSATNGAFTIQAGTGSIPATATILTSGASSNYMVGDTFTVDIRVNGGGNAFNAAQATVTTSSNLSVLGVGIVPASSGGCNFSYTVSPTIANPSFAGAILGGSSSACTVYTLTLRAIATGTGSIQFSNASVKSAVSSAEILSGVTNGSMTIGVPTTPSPTPTATPTTTATPTPTGSGQPSPTATIAPTANPVPTATAIPTATPATTCPAAFGKQADINNDGKVDITDLFQLANDWRKSTVQLLYSRSDINCDGIVDLTDLSILARLFGT